MERSGTTMAEVSTARAVIEVDDSDRTERSGPSNSSERSGRADRAVHWAQGGESVKKTPMDGIGCRARLWNESDGRVRDSIDGSRVCDTTGNRTLRRSTPSGLSDSRVEGSAFEETAGFGDSRGDRKAASRRGNTRPRDSRDRSERRGGRDDLYRMDGRDE